MVYDNISYMQIEICRYRLENSNIDYFIQPVFILMVSYSTLRIKQRIHYVRIIKFRQKFKKAIIKDKELIGYIPFWVSAASFVSTLICCYFFLCVFVRLDAFVISFCCCFRFSFSLFFWVLLSDTKLGTHACTKATIQEL